MATSSAPQVIIGAGPVGTALAALLARDGQRVRILQRGARHRNPGSRLGRG
ncbi:FAD-dependent monooxygenase [Rarobacter faecitabidus]|uniref:FAD-dependent monooxygenase n=1 Tax=Rarobacter faecitabidus TaxID=13243 RepID=UPI0011536780|nr:FAD-dependent monooxygenase [Rarobacter faecitabidus]